MSGWHEVALGTAAQFTGGGTPSKSQPSFWDGDIPWVSPKDMWVDEVVTSEDKITAAAIRASATNLIPANALLCVVRSGILARRFPVAITARAVAINQDIKAIIPGRKLDPRYLFYFLRASEPKILAGVTTGATVHRVGTDALKALRIPLPNLDEQRQIVAVLDEAFAAIATATANAEQNLANARELFDAELDVLVESARAKFPGRALAHCCRRVTVGHVGPMKDRYQPSGIPFLRSQNVRPFEIELAGVAFIDQGFNAELAKSRLTPGDVAVVRTGYPGTAAVIPKTLPISNCADLVILRPGADLNPHYLTAFLNSNLGKRMIAGNLVGAAQKHFNVGAAKKVPIPLPPLAEQQRFARRVEEMRRMSDRIASIYQAKLAHLAALTQSLLHRTFAGELPERAIALSATANDNFATPEFAAQILAFAHSRHVKLGRAANFGRVKAQKTLHAVEVIGGLDLGRQPIRDAAGPNDFAHMRRAEDWARLQGFFEFVLRANGGYDFRQLQNYEKLLDDAKQKLEQAGPTAKRAVELLVDMDSDFAEIVVTTHAAWNNLILDQGTITDDAIVQAAREDWHPDKLRYDKSRFHDAIRFIRSNGIEPNGSATRVGGQENLPL